ncbi:MAG: hypothetical protein U1D55_18030 [Phycisphaerae bacterium]
MVTRLTLRILLALGALAASAAAQDSLARFVPADVGLFVEARGVEDLLVSLTEPQLWSTLAEVAGQPAEAADAAEWRRRVKQTVKMEPADAIRTLFGRRVAFVGESPGRTQDGVVLCDVPPAEVKALLDEWKARQLSSAGGVTVYALDSGIALAVRGGTLVFGDGAPSDGLFRRVLRTLGNSASNLADDAAYRALLRRVPADPQGVLFARLKPAAHPASSDAQPALADLPGPLRGAGAILLALHRDRSLLRFTAVGDGRVPPARHRDVGALVATLPDRTLLTWSGVVDYAQLIKSVQALPERNVLRTAFKFQEPVVARLIGSLRGETTLAIGMVFPQNRFSGAPPMPALGGLVVARDGEQALSDLDTLLQACATVYNFLALAGGRPQLPQRETRMIEDVEVRVQDLTELTQGAGRDAVGELQLAWALDRDAIVFASHVEWLEQILRSRHGRARSLAESLESTQRASARESENVMISQSGPIADLGELWLAYFEKQRPELLTEAYWRQRQPAGHGARLGIDVAEDAERKALVVRSVVPELPAAAVTRPGDVIVGCGRMRFATTQPIAELRDAIEKRPNPRRVDLLVDRDGRTLELRVPLPYVDLVQMLRRVVAMGQIAQRVIYQDQSTEGEPARGVLTIELRKPGERLFDLAPPTRVQPTGDSAQSP